jgi:hypothetical protein
MWSVTSLPSSEGAYHGIRAVGKISCKRNYSLSVPEVNISVMKLKVL